MSRRARIVWGGWEGHEPEAGAQLVGAMLEEDGFEVDITPNLNALGAGDVGGLDLVIPVVTDGEIERASVERLVAAVRGGLGVGGYHGCLATSFPRTRLFNYLCGVQFVGHPGNIIDYRVDIVQPGDPIVAGIAGFAYRSEQYYLHYDPTVEVLATTTFSGAHDPVTAGVTMPVAFKRRFGQGRIFYSALGHVPAEFENPQMRTILRRGLNWAARAA